MKWSKTIVTKFEKSVHRSGEATGFVTAHWPLLLILAVFLVLSTAYNVGIPVLEKPDERWHYPYVKYLADGHGLPVYDPQVKQPWKQEGSQAPLYYALAALVTAPLDTDDYDSLRTANPFYLSYLHGPRGDNHNMYIHYARREGFPYRGAVLALHLARGVSQVMGLLTVVAAYLIAREIFPARRALAVGAAALVAFNPMFVFIASSVSNDATAAATSAWAAWAALRLALRPSAGRWRDILLAGVLLGLALLSKSNAVAVTPLTALALLRAASETRFLQENGFLRRRASGCLKTFLVWSVLVGGVVLLLDGWWWWRNWRLYGDPFGISLHRMVFANREPQPLWKLLGELKGVEDSFWAMFGWRDIPVDRPIYVALAALDRLALLGLALWAGKQVTRYRDDRHVQVGVVLLGVWALSIFVALLRFLQIAWGHHGRLLFPAIAGLAVLLLWGWRQFVPRRWEAALSAGVGLAFFAFSALALPIYIRPNYVPPRALRPEEIAAIPHRLEVTFGGQLRLLGYDVPQDTVRPGETLPVTLYWQAIAPMDKDYTIFVHVLDEVETVVAQRDTYPGLGRQPTSEWPVGKAIADTYVIPVPLTTYTPAEAVLEVGVYRHTTGERLPAVAADGQPLGDNVRFHPLRLLPRPGETPNPVRFIFGERIALVGYDLDRRVVHPGETIHVSLYWEALQDGTDDQTVFLQLLDEEYRKGAQLDRQPTPPTGSWRAGQRIVNTYELTVFPDAPPGVYDLIMGLYRRKVGRLPVRDEEGQLPPDADFLRLTRVRVVGE